MSKQPLVFHLPLKNPKYPNHARLVSACGRRGPIRARTTLHLQIDAFGAIGISICPGCQVAWDNGETAGRVLEMFSANGDRVWASGGAPLSGESQRARSAQDVSVIRAAQRQRSPTGPGPSSRGEARDPALGWRVDPGRGESVTCVALTPCERQTWCVAPLVSSMTCTVATSECRLSPAWATRFSRAFPTRPDRATTFSEQEWLTSGFPNVGADNALTWSLWSLSE